MSVSKRKYGLMTALAMVIGTVLGCGVFIKASAVLDASGGNLFVSLCAWLVGGIIMIASGFCFAVYANRVEKYNGCIDYIEYASNKKVGYFFGYFLGVLYFPIVGSNVALISARYIIRCFTDKYDYLYAPPVVIIAFIVLTVFFLINFLAPKISNKFQISVLFVKVAPVIIVAVIGVLAKCINQNFPGIIDAFKNPAAKASVTNFGEAVKITSYAYDGWIVGAALNAEMKNSKRDLPRAIVGGTIALLAFYLIFFISVSAIIGNQNVIDYGIWATPYALLQVFGTAGTYIFLVFIFLSCIGNVNSMTICTSRSLIALGYRNEGLLPKRMVAVDKNNNYKFLPYVMSYVLMCIYLLIWYFINKEFPVFKYLKSMDEVVCSLVYGCYIVVYIYMMKNFKNENKIIRFVMPSIAILGSAFFILCASGVFQAITTLKLDSLITFAVFLAFMCIAFIPAIVLYYNNHKKNKESTNEK